MNMKYLKVIILFLLCSPQVNSMDHSVAREWNELLIASIRKDYARPTVHARNLFHASVVMYDSWAVYDEVAQAYFLGRNVAGYRCDFDGINVKSSIEEARRETLSYAVYRLLSHRFKNSPGSDKVLPKFDSLMQHLGYDITFTSEDYSTGNPAALGNYLGSEMIAFGLQDGANEQADYKSKFYKPSNPNFASTAFGYTRIYRP